MNHGAQCIMLILFMKNLVIFLILLRFTTTMHFQKRKENLVTKRSLGTHVNKKICTFYYVGQMSLLEKGMQIFKKIYDYNLCLSKKTFKNNRLLSACDIQKVGKLLTRQDRSAKQMYQMKLLQQQS